MDIFGYILLEIYWIVLVELVDFFVKFLIMVFEYALKYDSNSIDLF